MDLTPHTPCIRTQVDLEDLWHDLLAPLGFTTPSLWLLVIGPDDRPVPMLTEVADTHELPDAEQRGGLGATLRRLVDELAPGGRIACLRSRPGPDPVGRADKAWARIVVESARRAGVRCDVVHVATDVQLVPVPLDDLPVSA
jgi:hypothetical protein